MPKRFIISVYVPGEDFEEHTTFKMKTIAYTDKNSIKQSIIDEFKHGLEETIANEIANKFGIPTADEVVASNQMTKKTKLNFDFTFNEE